MNQCGRLFRAEKVYAFYAEAEKHVVIVADVWLNPTADRVYICPNPLAMPIGAREFIVEGTTKPGIHPMYVVKHRISYSYPSDQTPKSVVVYTMGIDAPARLEVPVGSAPPPLQPEAKTGTGAPPPTTGPGGGSTGPGTSGPVEVTGFSASFSFEEAIHDALAQAAARLPPRNPDFAVSVEVKEISARAGGNIRPGLLIKAVAK